MPEISTPREWVSLLDVSDGPDRSDGMDEAGSFWAVCLTEQAIAV